ncbi:hypothetical protein CEP54_011281 [Fusarium duplospermum]|uniref:Uncharacterized protein n=1 Tax=Fusarium duplospermum TaxID=1325734 RepID=A0A428PFB1_9HYPO|nr:hypothetical protein CEP54_011281 [Fusarium duplospermum]
MNLISIPIKPAMSDTKMRPEDLPMWLPLREGCEWDSIFNIHECWDPEYDTLPLVLLRLAFWVFAVSPRFLWWLLVAYHFRRLINTSRTVVFLQSVSAAALCLIPWIWQSDYSRLRSQTEPFFTECWQLWFLLSSPNILFMAYHLPGTILDGIVLARDYAYQCMDLEILFPGPGEWDLDVDPRDTAGEAFFRRLLTEDREMRRRKESEEQARREHESAMREQEREVKEREAVRRTELEELRRQRARREAAARQEGERRGYDPDADFSGLAAIFRRTARRWRPLVPEPEPELELTRVKVQDPRSKGTRKVIAFYSRGTQTEPRDLPGERTSGEVTSSRYTSNGVQTDSMTEEKQHKATASKPQEKAASSPARDPQPSRPTPTPAPESPMVQQTADEPTDEPSERPQPPVSASPEPSAPSSTPTPSGRQHARSPRKLFGARVSTNLQGRHPSGRVRTSRDVGGRVRAQRRLGRGRPGRLSGTPDGGRVDETPSETLESSTLEAEQVEEQVADTNGTAAASSPAAAAADQSPLPAAVAPDTTSSVFKRPEDFDDFEEWLNSSLPPADLEFFPPVDLAPATTTSTTTTTTTTAQDLSGLPDGDLDAMALGDLLGSALGELSLDDDAEIRSTSDLMDLDSPQDQTAVGQEQLASEMEIVIDDSGDVGPLISLSPEMDWEGEEGPDIVMDDVEAPPAPPTCLVASMSLPPSAVTAPSTIFAAASTTPAPPTTPVAPITPALPRTPSPKGKEASSPEPPAAPRRRQVSSPLFFNFTQPTDVTDVAQSGPQDEETDRSQEELDELERDLIAAFEDDDDDSDVVTVVHISPPTQGLNHPLPSTNDDQPPLVDPALFANTVPAASQTSTNQAASGADQPQEASQEEMSKRRILKPRTRRTKDTVSAPAKSRQTSLQSVSEQNEQGQDQAPMDDTAQNLVLLAGLEGIPVGNITQPQPQPTPPVASPSAVPDTTAQTTTTRGNNQTAVQDTTAQFTTPVAPPSAVPDTTAKSTTTRGNNQTAPRQEQQDRPSSAAASQPTPVPAIQMDGPTLPGGNIPTTTPTPTPSSHQPQENASSSTAANQTANIPAVQMGGLILPGGNMSTTTPTPTPTVPQPPQQNLPSSTAANHTANVQSIQMGGLILPGGNTLTTTPTPTAQQDPPKQKPMPQGPRKGSVFSDTFMTESPDEMTPSQTPTRSDSTPTGTTTDLRAAELQRAIRRQAAKKGKKPQLFNSKKSNLASSTTSSTPSTPVRQGTPSTPVRQGSTDTAMEAESSDAAAERLLSGSNSKKKITVVKSSSVPQHLRDQEREGERYVPSP